MTTQLDTQTLLREVDRAAKGVAEAGYVEAKKELSQNVYPLLRILIESLGSRIDEAEGVIMELLQGAESVLAPDVSARISQALLLSLNLSQIVHRLGTEETDQERHDSLMQAKEIAQKLHESATLAQQVVHEITIEAEGDEDHGVEVAHLQVGDGVDPGESYEEFDGSGPEEYEGDDESGDGKDR